VTKRSWLILLLLLLTGCASNNQTTTPSTNTPETISLDFAVNPTKPTPNQAVTLTAKVMAGQKPVNDATVELEVWQDGS
jgi:predicted component of type VI protein secretion system